MFTFVAHISTSLSSREGAKWELSEGMEAADDQTNEADGHEGRQTHREMEKRFDVMENQFYFNQSPVKKGLNCLFLQYKHVITLINFVVVFYSVLHV